ncbi:hypothetical protein EYF80_064664 [Liparis tanakae]|uniref:Uncharacterized protein n=1 Tax=Liparis tanakae TaxID=230148 RepID=A0A4Z2E8S3_9TELE|nr:hypothetical protein EYF80_064664 [Liparis tanakae]
MTTGSRGCCFKSLRSLPVYVALGVAWPSAWRGPSGPGRLKKPSMDAAQWKHSQRNHACEQEPGGGVPLRGRSLWRGSWCWAAMSSDSRLAAPETEDGSVE